jgi:hypothetical protein
MDFVVGGLGGLVIGVALGVTFGSSIAAEVKKGFEAVSQTIHERITSLESSIKSKV